MTFAHFVPELQTPAEFLLNMGSRMAVNAQDDTFRMFFNKLSGHANAQLCTKREKAIAPCPGVLFAFCCLRLNVWIPPLQDFIEYILGLP